MLRLEEVKGLSPVQRLFGVAGWRGLVRVARLEPVEDAGTSGLDLTSVTIDRFTGGGIDQRLYTEQTFLNAAFDVDLVLERRKGYPNAEDEALFEVLIADIMQVGKGLDLGHGGAKGFGWFEAEARA